MCQVYCYQTGTPSGSMQPMRTALRAPLALLLAASAIAGVSIAVRAQRPVDRFDVLIVNGRIVDGTGSPWFRGDVGVIGDRIAAVGSLAGAAAGVTIDATNLIVAPGFMDLLGQSEFNVLVDNRAASKILQGVTTEITGEGQSIAPVNDRIIEEGAPPTTTSRSPTTGTRWPSTSPGSPGPDRRSTSG